MRSTPVVLVLTLLWKGLALASSAGLGLYNEANEFYRRGEFEGARQKYLEVAASGVRNSRLFYNLGNASFKSGRLGEAILWYERALRVNPRDADIRANLRFVNLVKKDRDPAPAENVVWRFLLALYLFPTPDELCVVFCLVSLLVFVLAVWRLRLRAKAPALWLALFISCSGLTVLAGSWGGWRIHRQETMVEAIVVVEQATARSGPDARQTTVLIVHEGTKVRVERQEREWRLVRLANGLGGWLPATSIVPI
jgi:tetratricopeptide (TPR) repeat protein